MVEPLRKRRANGSLYRRRHEIEKELEELEAHEPPEVLARAREGEHTGKVTVSSEALMHILRREVRVVTTRSSTLGPIDGLIQILIQRAEAILRRHLWRLAEIDREEICKQVVDRIVDEIYEDSDLADYAEVNFNDWLRHNRLDAFRKQTRKIERTERLGDSVEDIAENEALLVQECIDDKAATEPTPEAAYASNEAHKMAALPAVIQEADLSPEDRYRIAAMVQQANLPPHVLDAFLLHHYLGMQIESEDLDKHTLVKQFDKSEKTIRLWIKRAEKA